MSISCQDQCTAEDNLDYGLCPGFTGSPPLYLTCFLVQPYPVVWQENQTLSINAYMDLFVNVSLGSKVKVRVTKEASPTPVSIPCFNTTVGWGPVGSCDYDGDSFLRLFYPFFCPAANSPRDCSLPLTNGSYGRSEPYNVTIPKLDQNFGFLLDGTFDIEIRVENENRTETICVYFTVELVQAGSSTTVAPTTTTSGPATCDQCQEHAGRYSSIHSNIMIHCVVSLLSQMSTGPSLTEQSLYLTQHCTSIPDNDTLVSWWPDMATCLYQKWVLPDFTCLYLGGCQHVSQPWLCQDVSHLMSQLFADTGSLSVNQGAEALLHGDCFCGNPDHIIDSACNSTVSSLLPMVLPGMSDWITNRTDWMCTDTSNGADTCSECQGQVGRSLTA